RRRSALMSLPQAGHRFVGGGVSAALAVLSVVGVIWAAGRGSTPAPECTGAHSLDFGCFADRYEVLTRTAGPDAALNELDDQHTTNTYGPRLHGCLQDRRLPHRSPAAARWRTRGRPITARVASSWKT